METYCHGCLTALPASFRTLSFLRIFLTAFLV